MAGGRPFPARHLVVPAGLDVAVRTGTAQVSGSGVDSWVTAVLDGRYVLTLVVHHPAQTSAAIDTASRILPGLPRSFGGPVCPELQKETDR